MKCEICGSNLPEELKDDRPICFKCFIIELRKVIDEIINKPNEE